MLIDVSSISWTINYTNTSSLRELSLGVSICLYMDLIKSLNIFSFKTKVLKTLSLNFLHGLEQETQSWQFSKTKSWQLINSWMFQNPSLNSLDQGFSTQITPRPVFSPNYNFWTLDSKKQFLEANFTFLSTPTLSTKDIGRLFWSYVQKTNNLLSKFVSVKQRNTSFCIIFYDPTDHVRPV